MLRKRYITMLACAAVGIIGCGGKPVATTKAPTIAEVSAKMEVVTPTPIVDPAECNNLANSTTQGRCFDRVEGCNKLGDNDKRACLQHLKVCLSTTIRKRRCFGRSMTTMVKVKPTATPTPKPKPQTIRECLTDAGFTVEVDADAPTFITVNGDDGMAVAFLEQMATAQDARESQAMIDDMEADAKEQAGEDGWTADGTEDIPNENVGRYVITYMYPEDGEQDAIHNCVESFTRSK